jgi:quercetin dioxygenase-like cupin family protein
MNLKLTTVTDAPKVPFDIDGRILFSGNRTEVIHLTLSPGEKLDMHDNPADTVFYMIQGPAVLILSSEEVRVETGSCFGLESGVLRGWHNRGTEKVKILVIKQTG